MSYNVRDDAAIFGPNASVELLNGAGAPTIAKMQVVEPAIFTAGVASEFVESDYYTIFLSPPLPSNASALQPLGGKFQVAGASMYYSTAATGAAVLNVEICPPGTANGSGNNVLSTAGVALNTAATTTPTNLTLNTNVDDLQLVENARLNVYANGAATTGLVDFIFVAYLIRY
jgi:hypothetical protein